MSRNRHSGHTDISDGDERRPGLIDRRRLNSLTVMLAGLSQLLLVSTFPMKSWTSFIVGGGGWLLIAIGFNTYIDREVMQGGWKSERVKWITAIIAFIIVVGMVVVAVLIPLT